MRQEKVVVLLAVLSNLAVGCAFDDVDGEAENSNTLNADDITFRYTEGSTYIEVDIASPGPDVLIRSQWILPDGSKGVSEVPASMHEAGQPYATVRLPMVGEGTYSLEVQELLSGRGVLRGAPMLVETMTLHGAADVSSRAMSNSEETDCEPGAVIVGTNGPDVLLGTEGNDVLHGRRGSDIIYAGPCNDMLYGEGGNDRLDGGDGDDGCDGGPGQDQFIRCEVVQN